MVSGGCCQVGVTFFWFMFNKFLRNWKVFFQNKSSVSVHFFGDDWSVITSHQMHILEGQGWLEYDQPTKGDEFPMANWV